MFTDARRENTYVAYRARLRTYLHIAPEASDQNIRELIDSGFPASTAKSFCDAVKLSPADRGEIIHGETLTSGLALGKPLTPQQSKRLYRFVHITAMAESIFGSDEKAMQWLSKPKGCFSGKSPFSMLATNSGADLVEEMLIQLAEGFAF
ncbi:antitoxin Xre/MbcA/ParS toxin-binding domain-containing protein [Pseudomonas sp. ICMP 561]|uniref:antitoxin Xre/MbcA/ParS toxin-binding domain-containing protein n=1 Tax=Pseudomonas sp. ICMP 561 TaxID=1718918 RepID=UPI000C080E47|nr:antitoxin Xre/MbcA/ParS toxin-binding domain-containing protein [Pseudomonas sp. ICMP 561]PHN27126.1 antitoxin [Pseudomonas sp. ICMP 561]